MREVDKGKAAGQAAGWWVETFLHCSDNDPCVAKAERFESAGG